MNQRKFNNQRFLALFHKMDNSENMDEVIECMYAIEDMRKNTKWSDPRITNSEIIANIT